MKNYEYDPKKIIKYMYRYFNFIMFKLITLFWEKNGLDFVSCTETDKSNNLLYVGIISFQNILTQHLDISYFAI